jgi:hypothetical protein
MEIKRKTREEVNQEWIQRLVHESRRQQNLEPTISDASCLIRVVSISGVALSSPTQRSRKAKPSVAKPHKAAV